MPRLRGIAQADYTMQVALDPKAFAIESSKTSKGIRAPFEDGIFRWPKIENGVMTLSAAQLSALLEGLDWRRVHEAQTTVTPTLPS